MSAELTAACFPPRSARRSYIFPCRAAGKNKKAGLNFKPCLYWKASQVLGE
ncbi:hypothetical protein GCWU000341_01768 [Oribacterium sp. oral taxon 078 str. F0262]|nr:hypothetical protein GCWU000341_01768 [Oribacterium sp. oral taxon 078 str. F0262]